ncbi:MAG: PEFG-CTERM sorting domain-containing protein [Nitrosopumilaceae archaeon]
MNHTKSFDKSKNQWIKQTVRKNQLYSKIFLILFVTGVSMIPYALAQTSKEGDGTDDVINNDNARMKYQEITNDAEKIIEKGSSYMPTDIHGSEADVPINCSTITVTNGGSEGVIPYCIANGSVESASLDATSHSLLIDITTAADGWVSIKGPKHVFDAANTANEDIGFLVSIDGEMSTQKTTNPELILLDDEKGFAEIRTTDDARTLTIEFESGADKIKIEGTSVIPEFGTVAILVLIFAITSLIIFSKRVQLPFSSTY